MQCLGVHISVGDAKVMQQRRCKTIKNRSSQLNKVGLSMIILYRARNIRKPIPIYNPERSAILPHRSDSQWDFIVHQERASKIKSMVFALWECFKSGGEVIFQRRFPERPPRSTIRTSLFTKRSHPLINAT